MTLPRELSGNTKAALVPRLHPGAHLRLRIIETMMFFSENQITYTKNQSEIVTLAVFPHNLNQRGPVMTLTGGLRGSQVENEDPLDQVLVMCRRGTKTCRRESKFQFKRLKNRSLTLFKRGRHMVSIICSSFCLLWTLLTFAVRLSHFNQDKLVVINWVDDENWPPCKVFNADASLW